MFHIVIHCKPKEENEEYFGKVINADASILIDYKDYDGAMLFNIRDSSNIGSGCFSIPTRRESKISFLNHQ